MNNKKLIIIPPLSCFESTLGGSKTGVTERIYFDIPAGVTVKSALY